MLEGIVRESIGKKAAKALKRDGYLIANIYGKGLENINAAFKMGEYLKAVKNKETIAFDIKIGDKELKVVVQAYQIDPIKDTLLHVDLIVAQKGVSTLYYVPVSANGIADGIKDKGVLMVSKKRIPIKSTIENLPNVINIDVTPLAVGDSILIRDLPENDKLDIRLSDRVAVLSIIKAK